MRRKEKIAVIGMGGLFPGSETLEQFWQNLIENKDLVRSTDDVDFGASPDTFFHDEKGKLDKCYSMRGGYVRDFEFDAQGYKLPANILKAQDGQFKWSLYVAKKALEHSGYWGHDNLKRCGAIVGNLSFPTRFSRQIFSPVYADMASEVIEELTGETVKVPFKNTNYPADVKRTLLTNAPAALIAQAIGIKGTHYSLDAACASSLYAIKLACDELHTGKADMMLAGAVSGSDPLFIQMGFSYFHAYARENEPSAPMDKHSGGLTSAEGAGMVVLKRLSDAQKDGDNILAVIDSVGLSNDGKGKFLLSPNPKGQRLALERAYQESELNPEQIDYLECHATGTPLGDRTEINSISNFFGEVTDKMPYLGSVKSNMGHLLTAAGMTSMLKVIMAMDKKMIPATIKVSSPMSSDDKSIADEQIVAQNKKWEQKGDIPRAGVNAFGFGGTNAHMVISAYDEKVETKLDALDVSKQEMAITGMDVHFGNCKSLEEYYLSIFQGKQLFKPLPETRWKGMENLDSLKETFNLPPYEQIKGAWVEDFDFNLLRFKIQPKEAERLTIQQTFMLTVVDRALEDAGINKIEGTGANVAVIIAMESELEIHHRMGRWDLSWQVNRALKKSGLDMEEAKKSELTSLLRQNVFPAFEDHSPSEHTGFIGNIIASRISALCDFTGPSFTISSNENATYKGLEVARNLLAMGEVDAVILGGLDLTGSMEGVLSRHVLNPINTGDISMSWNEGTDGWAIGEGAGAIVLKRAEDTAEDRVYAKIDNLALTQSNTTDLRGKVSAEVIEQTVQKVLTESNVKPTDIGLLEVSGNGIAEDDQAEIQGITKVYQTDKDVPTCALGSSKANIGHTFSASGVASIIKTALSLYYRFVPVVPNWKAPKNKEAFKNTPFYVPQYSTPWVYEEGQKVLRASVSGIGSDGTYAHLLMSEGNHPDPNEAGAFLLKGGERLFPINGNNANELLAGLDKLQAEVSAKPLQLVSDMFCEDFVTQTPKKPKTLVLVATSEEGLKREITVFKKALPNAEKTGKPVQMPSGSYYTPNPMADKGKSLLMYPGSGSAYTGLGNALFQAFPGLYDYINSGVEEVSRALFSERLYPRYLSVPTAEEKKESELYLQQNAIPMMAIGVAFSAMYTQILEKFVAFKADSVAGYSMGETSSMWYCQDLWDTHYVDEKFMYAPFFREKAGGDMKLLGKVWNMPFEQAKDKWRSLALKLPNGIQGYASLREWYEKAVQPNTERVYLTFVNTATDIVLSGDKDELIKIQKDFNIQGVTLTINNVVHHSFCRQEEQDLIEMHDLPIERQPNKVYYSSITGKPLKVESAELAQNATEVCCKEVDLPALVNQLYKDGHRMFIELGANATCTKWFDEILEEQAHSCIPSDKKGASSLKNVNSMVAMLLSNGADLNLSHFYDSYQAQQKKRKPISKVLRTGGQPYRDVITAENKAKFAGTVIRVGEPEPEEEPIVETVAEPIAEPVLEPAFEGVEAKFMQSAPLEENHKKEQIQEIPEIMLENKVELKKAENGLSLQNYEDPAYKASKNPIWDEKDLLTFAEGKIADVFGKEFDIIDTYSRRVMLPMPPYLLVSRVTKLDAKTHEYKPSSVTTEYDIPYNSFFATDGQIPWAVAVESGQCDLLLISYLGIDFQNKGEYVYRLLDCTLTFLDDLPYEGQTLRYDIKINSFVRQGKNLLFFFSYECFVEDRMVLKMDGGCAGFFSDEELSHGQGVVFKQSEIDAIKNRERKYFEPLLFCDKTSFNRDELLALTKGDFISCFNDTYEPQGLNKSLRLPPEGILMLDRITKVDRQGGSSGLGFIEAEKDLLPDDWYFPCHFRDDEVLAGSLQAEGGGQLLRFFMLYLGMQRLTKDARYQPVLDLPQKVRCRKEVPPKEAKLIYRMDVKEVGLTPEPYVIADLEIHYDGMMAVHFENLGLKLQEKDNPTYLKSTDNLQGGIYVKPVDKPVLLNEYHITQFALGPVSECFGDEYKVYDGRSLSRQPNTDLQFISRVLEVQGERHKFGGNPTIIAEYDVPADAWYYKQNANDATMPYSVLMEVALQPCGFLGAYLGSTLSFPDKDLFFRNLDGDGTMVKDVDLRGKTVTNKCVLVSHTNLAGTVLQRYTFELEVDGEVFYVGNSSFGFFTKADLSSQAGLDQGKKVGAWLNEADYPKSNAINFKLDSLFGKMKLYRSTNPASPKLHLSSDQLNLIDTASVVKDGGKYGKGYVYASKAVKAYEWFFTCHFYQDSVMPGSLGVEAIFQAIQLYAVQQGLGANLKNVGFKHLGDNHKTVWKYRGQILQTDPEMNLEVHIKEVETSGNEVVIKADASLWKGELRIYELTDMAVVLGE